MRTLDQHPRQVVSGSEPSLVSSEALYAVLSDLGQLLRSLDPAVLYEAVIEILERRIGARLVMVGDVDHHTGWLRRIAPAHIASGMEDIYPEQLLLAVAQPSFWQGAPQLETNLRQTPGLETFRQTFARHGITSSIAVPAMTFGEVHAALVIRSSNLDFFSASMIELLQQVAWNMGLGLEAYEQRTRLLASVKHESSQRRALRLLIEMIKVVSHSKGESQLLIETCQVIRGSEEYDHAWIYLAQGDTAQDLEPHACSDFSDDDESILPITAYANEIATLATRVGDPLVRYSSSSGLVESPNVGDAADRCALLALL